MKEQTPNSSASQFLKTDGGKTKSNAIEVPSISLPKGGGAIKGIDEKFSVNAVNGTASFSIPLPFSPARGASPSLALSYNSGAGNGIFGLGWNLSLTSIKRKTDKRLPEYIDIVDSDTYLFSEAEDLVPEFKKEKKPDGSIVFEVDPDGEYKIFEKDSPDGSCKIRYYKPRIEGLFARIERWTEKTSGLIKWRVITKENVTTLFGWSTGSVIADPKDPVKIFEWFPEFVFDDKGNCSQFMYKKEDDAGFDKSRLHNRNRLISGKITYTNLYLEKVLYGNKTPYIKFADPFPVETDYFFNTVFDYGEYDTNSPYTKIKNWDFRSDAFSDYKSGFEIRTTRLCKRVLLYHHFKVNEYDGLVRSMNFEYDTSSEKDFTFLKSITSIGYIKKADSSYTHKKLPALEFDYQKHEWKTEVKSIDAEAMVHAPSGLDEEQYQFTDLFNEGLPGILSEQANGWYYKHNLGGGKFERAKLVTPKPSFLGLGDQLHLADLDSDGGKQLVSYGTEPKGYFELNDDNEWQPFKNFRALPNVNFGDANTRMLDLNGDGKAEILITEDNVFTWYPSEGRNGYSPAYQTIKPFDEEAGPHIVFSDKQQTVFLADMSGDGMNDIVRIRNGEVCYWPNLGYGKFGAKILMDNAPLFDHPDLYNPGLLRLADIDGSGPTDIIYLGKNQFSCWMNLSGNAFRKVPFEISAFPDIHNHATITVIDLLGNGVACIVWSSPLLKDIHSPIRYIDLMNSKKPHIMVSYKNNLGKEVSLEYSPSTKFYIQDKLAGKPWITKLHFPVHCISKTETRDKISGYRFVTSYTYHHGYYDHAEREFRGFGMVEQRDAEHFEHWVKGNASNIVDKELHLEPVVSKSWVHTGAFLGREKILHQFAKEYWYEEMKKLVPTLLHHEVLLPDARIVPAPWITAKIINELSADEWQEALRACKGISLRSEVFAQDAPLSGATPTQIEKQLTPYSVSTHNCVIELLQPKGKNKHAIFVVNENEAITYNYERNPEDPRIAHTLNIKLDEYGNALESASIVYPRLKVDSSLPNETKEAQKETHILYVKTSYTDDVFKNATDDITGVNTFRLRLPSEVKTYELKGVSKTSLYYSIANFIDILEDVKSNVAEYHELDKILVAGIAQRRLLEHICSTYYKNDLTGPMPLHQLESLAIPFESYQLAYTPPLLTDIFGPINAPGSKITNANMAEGMFTNHEGDNNWWIRSGTTQYTSGGESTLAARNRFYVPLSYTDPYGSKTKVKFYSDYFLFIEETEDDLKNKARVPLFNFRTLSPQRMSDINLNLSEVITDELGLVKALAVMGKGNEADELTGLSETTEALESTLVKTFFNGPDSVHLTATGKDLLQHATARFVYDFDVYKNSGKPVVVASIVREVHFIKKNNSPIQLSFEYSNGLGQVVMQKVQAEPGQAKKVTVNPDKTYSVTNIDTAALAPKQLRWIGNGRTLLNNKGNAVKQYEPYFSVTHQYEDLKELVETGVTPILYYDALGRMIKTTMPDGTLSRTEFDSWKQCIYDANDTVLDPECVWYLNRFNRRIDAQLLAEGKDPVKEKQAAYKASRHADTPTVLHFDTLGRPILQIENNGKDLAGLVILFETKIELDIEGNLRKVTDARKLLANGNKGNIVMQYKYDMLGNLVYQNSMDAGQRWLLLNILGDKLRTWDERNHEFQYFYDKLHRLLESKVTGGDGPIPLDYIFDKIIYGESQPNPKSKNLRGKIIQHYDTGGMIDTPDYDFKGQPKFTTRKLFKNYKSVANWIGLNLINDLEGDFTFVSETDALGRITKQIAPDKSTIIPSYNEAGLLNKELVNHHIPLITTTYIKDIDYNEKGQRNKIIYGNDVVTRFYYDIETFRLKRLESKKQNNEVLQDLFYTYDPVGNITTIEDKAIPISFFANALIESISEYSYDALYRLVEATGRENNIAITFGSKDNWNDAPFMHQVNSGDPLAVHNYKQTYLYDEVGNIKETRHQAAGNDWTRTYEYEASNNRMKSTKVGQGASSFTYLYPHHAQHGYMIEMPQLEEMGWNFKEELIKTLKQKVNPNNGTAETTFYQYDGQGQRIRKITENQAAAGMTPAKKDERIYISGYELYKKHSGTHSGLERSSLSLMDEGHRFVMIETRNDTNDGTEKHLVRYQLHNHLSSACLEMDATAQMISYEEYHPYGTTAYQANNATIKAAAKRYRYTGMERDEETGLNYHGARYYLPWLGRWMSCDPSGLKDGSNVYQYARHNPICILDKTGRDGTRVTDSRTDSEIKQELETRTQKTVADLWIQSGHGPTEINLRELEQSLYENGTLKHQTRETKEPVVQDEVVEPHPYNADRYVVKTRVGPEKEIERQRVAGIQTSLQDINQRLAASGQRIQEGPASTGIVKTPGRAVYGKPKIAPAPQQTTTPPTATTTTNPPTSVPVATSTTPQTSTSSSAPQPRDPRTGRFVSDPNRPATSRPNTTSAGIVRHNPTDWREWRDSWDKAGMGDILSVANRTKIAKGNVPTVDAQWRAWFPDAIEGEQISIHHIMGSPINVPLTTSQHFDAHNRNWQNPGGPGQAR